MSSFLPAKYILTDFLRTRLIDPRSRAETTNTESFTATAAQTDFSLTAPLGKVQCITLVTVDAVTMLKYQDYWIDFRNQKVIMLNALNIGQSVEITYKFGTSNWVFWDKPREKIKPESFPRINILVVSGSGLRLGNYQAPVESTIHFQIDI
jgi:hypothetical protein